MFDQSIVTWSICKQSFWTSRLPERWLYNFNIEVINVYWSMPWCISCYHIRTYRLSLQSDNICEPLSRIKYSPSVYDCCRPRPDICVLPSRTRLHTPIYTTCILPLEGGLVLYMYITFFAAVEIPWEHYRDYGMDKSIHHVKQWDVDTHPCPNFNGGLIKPPLKLKHGWVIASLKNLWM